MESTGRPAASWFPDPTGRHEHRYWDGERWTVHVADHGVTGVDGPTQQPTTQQPTTPRPTAQQPTTQQPTTGWSPVADRPVPTPQHSWQPSTASSASQPAAAAAPPVRSSKGRVWAFALAFAFAVAGIGATAMLALGRDDDTATSAVSGDRRYPETVETGFMQGCTSTGGTESYCRCALDRLEQSYDLGEFEDATISYATTGKLPDTMMDAARDCLPKLYE